MSNSVLIAYNDRRTADMVVRSIEDKTKYAQKAKKTIVPEVEITMCCNCADTIKATLSEKPCSVILLFASFHLFETLKLIDELHEMYPDMMIYAAMYTAEQFIFKRYSGIDNIRFVILPSTISRIADLVLFTFRDYSRSIKDIADFLRSNGITEKYLGFITLALALEHAVNEPDCLKNIVENIYNGIAKELGSRSSRVERNIRTIRESFSKSAENDDGKSESVRNKEFIRDLRDRYVATRRLMCGV